MRIPRGAAVVFALALAVLMTGISYPSRLAAGGHGPNPGVNIMRPGPDWRSLIVPGQTITIDVGVGNLRGDAAAHDTVLTVLLPSGLSLKQSTAAPSRTETAKNGVRLTWNLGVMEAGAFPRMFDLDLQAAAGLKRGTALTVEASVSTTDKVVDEGNARNAFVLYVENAAADLIVKSSLDSAPFTVDHPVDFAIELTNLGTVSAAACALAMTLPPKAALKSSDPSPAGINGNRVTWNFGDLAPAQSQTVKVKLVLDPILRAAAYGFAPRLGNLRFTFDSSTTTNQFNPARGHLEIARFVEPAGSNVAVSLNVTGADHPGELPIGKDVTYEITYGNFGNAPASDVSVSLNLPDGLTLVSAAPPASHSIKDATSGGNTYSWDLGDLAVGRSATIKSQVHVISVPAGGSLVSAAISAAGKDVSSQEKTAYSLRYAARR